MIIFIAVSLSYQKTQVLWSQIHPTLPQPLLSQLGASGPVPGHIYFLNSKILTVPIYLLVNCIIPTPPQPPPSQRGASGPVPVHI